MIARLLALFILLICAAPSVRAIDYQCRTSPVGASTQYCASEAFVTRSVNPVVIVPATPVTSTTLQDAITRACSAANAIVQIPVGNWSIDTTSSAITIASPCPAIIIQGSGGDNSTTPNGSRLINTAAANDLFNVTTEGSVRIRDLALNANVTKNAATAAIRFNAATTSLGQQIIERVTINNFCNSIEVDNSYAFVISKNQLTSFTCEGIVATQPDSADQGNGLIEGNLIWDVSGTAGADSCILWHRGSGMRVIGNRCLGAMNYGLHIKFDKTSGDDGSMIVSNNTFEVQNLSGIFLERTAAAQTAGTKIGQMVFTSNFIQTLTPGNTGAFNIATSGLSPWVQGCTFSANSIQVTSAPAFNGVVEDDASDQCNINDNMIYTTGGIGAGIRVSGVSTNTKVINNSNDGTTAATKYGINSGTIVIDKAGATVANLPAAAANGSEMFASDGAPGSSPCTGTSTGAMAFRINGAWKCF